MEHIANKYKSLYLWAIIPFAIIQVGIFNYYWPKFPVVTWEIHIHYWLVSAWYLLVIYQSYLVKEMKIITHRTIGIIGFFIAGGLTFSAISMLDIPLKLIAANDPSRPGPPVAFFYGTLVVEFTLAIAFVFAVVKSIIHRRETSEHSWWLICSLFYLLAPALGRGLIVFWRTILPPENFSPIFPLLSTELVYLTLFLIFALKFGRIRHLASYIAFALIIVRALRFPIGNSAVVQQFLENVIKW